MTASVCVVENDLFPINVFTPIASVRLAKSFGAVSATNEHVEFEKRCLKALSEL